MIYNKKQNEKNIKYKYGFILNFFYGSINDLLKSGTGGFNSLTTYNLSSYVKVEKTELPLSFNVSREKFRFTRNLK